MGLPRSVMRIVAMLRATNAAAAPRFRSTQAQTDAVKRFAFHVRAMEPLAA